MDIGCTDYLERKTLDFENKIHDVPVVCKQELINRIYKYCDEINEAPVVYHWTYKTYDITAETLATKCQLIYERNERLDSIRIIGCGK